MATWDEISRVRHQEVLEKQALHRRLRAAEEAGVEPDPDDVAAAAKFNESPYRYFDRVYARDDY
ncbi:MAG: hypothetical protein ACRDOY_06535 [Nocardioidaceae bacterium]